MGKREFQRGKLDREFVEEDDRVQTPNKSVVNISDDDEEDEANEDLSLKIVEKALLMRAAKLVPDDAVSFSSNGVDSVMNNTPSSGVAGDKVVNNATEEKKRLIKKVKKKKLKKTEIAHDNDVETKEDIDVVVSEVTEPKPVAVANNAVLRKLLRGPRYFDPPDNSWGTCYNCGEEGHAAVNCKSARRKKPCFVCGSFEHNAKQCNKGQDCFTCRKSGHRAKDCPDKYKGSSTRSNICLKCGYGGHDMFSCQNDYEHDDLKEICCYVCKKVGHLCCVKYADSCKNVVSCYRCGRVGHTGLSCTGIYGDTTGTDAVASSCFRCGECGHFARECTNSYQVGKRDREPSTPTLRVHREQKHKKQFASAPHDLGKAAHKKKKSHHHEPSVTTPQKSKHRGGWIMDDPVDFSYDNGRNNSWRSPATPAGNYRGRWMTEDHGDFSYDSRRKQSWRSPASPYSQGHRISTITAGGHVSNSQSSKRTRKGYANPHFQGSYNAW